jgi:hypothetical protein
VLYTAKVAPAHPGKKTFVSLEYNFHHRWKDGGSQGFRESDDGSITIYFARGALPPGKYRLRSTFTGDTDHLGAPSDRDFFKIEGRVSRGRRPQPLALRPAVWRG